MNLRYFSITEFECRCKCGRAPMDEAFLLKLDELRHQFGKPLAVSSGYRCSSHNQRVSSTGIDGPHTTGKAADLRVDRADAHRLLGLALSHGFTGIGVQQKGGSRFLHLDTLTDGPRQPRPTVWSY